jgi:hypothetical protein
MTKPTVTLPSPPSQHEIVPPATPETSPPVQPETPMPVLEVAWEFIGTTSFWDTDKFISVKIYGWVRDPKDGSIHREDEFSDPLDPSSGRTFVGFSADGIIFTIPDVHSYAQGIIGIRPTLLSIDKGEHWIKIESLPFELEESIKKWGNAYDDPVLIPSTWEAVVLREGNKIILYGSYQYFPVDEEGKPTEKYSRSKWYRAEIPITTIEGLSP